jgi:PAS domain S-box-containing protein
MEDARTIGEGIRQVMRRELSNFSYEYACDSSIESRWFIAEVTRFRIGDSERLLIAHNNITERKWSDLRISQLTRHYQDLFENSGTNIIIVDENDRYLLVNNKAAQSFGVAREDILGKSMADLLPLQTAVRYHEKNRQLLQAGGSREYEDTFTMPGGEITYLIVDQCIQDETGRNFAIQSSSIDITARKKIEQALLESRERLTRLSHYLVETQEQERRRIARELHDEIGQTLTALTIALSGISKAAPDAVFARNLEGLNSLTHDLVQQVGALSSELRPRVLDDLGLVPGLVSLINRLAAQTGIEIDFKHGPLGYISPEIETTAYRIIQESLTNVIRHAQVRLAAVRIQLDSGSLWIQVQDGGVGFEYQVAIRSAGSMGLMSMQERAELVGGSFSIQTAQGEGTSITCRLPLGDLPIERRSHDRD